MRVYMHCTFSCAKRGYGGDLVFINKIKDLILNAIYSFCESLGIKCHEASYNYIVVGVFFLGGGGLRVSWDCQFSGANEKEAVAAILILINRSYVHLKRRNQAEVIQKSVFLFLLFNMVII